MGFSPVSLGLPNERISSKFREPRESCPHKGIDITSSRKARPFVAGVFGRIISPIEGPWGTITVSPFNAPATRIQYLHCSAINVGIGQLVCPWTVLGNTGDTAPPNTGITGIHLHLQVQEPGAGGEKCWNARRFVDPETFPTPDLVRGTWRANSEGSTGGISWTREAVLRISGSEPGAPVSASVKKTYTVGSGEQCSHIASWGTAQISTRQQDGTLIYQSGPGSCYGTSGCGGCSAEIETLDIRLRDANTLSISGNYNMTRVSAFSELITGEAEFVALGHPKVEGAELHARYVTSVSMRFDEVDTGMVAASFSGLDENSLFGVHDGEKF